MGSRLNLVSLVLCILTILLPLATAQDGTPNSSGSHGGSSTSSSSSAAAVDPYTQSPSFKKSARILIVHAVLGTLAWAFFAPLGAIFLRLNIPGVNRLKFHVVAQVLVYVMTIVTTGLGIWIAIRASKYGSVWMDGHVIIGLIVFCVGSIQPWLGWIHHIVFQNRLTKQKKGMATERPGRTTTTRLHVWIGRVLILLGVVNGGLGIRLAAGSPFQTASTTRNAEIAYGVVAGLMFLVFAGVSIVFEHRCSAPMKSRRTGQQMPAQTGDQPELSNRNSMSSSPGSSEDSLALDEKASEGGR